MAINTTIGTPTPGSNPTAIAGSITLEISNPVTNRVLAVGVGMSAEQVRLSLIDTKNSAQRVQAPAERDLREASARLADFQPNPNSSDTVNQRRKASLEAEVAALEKKIANAASDIEAADEALAYVSSGQYQTAIDQLVKEATQPAVAPIATPDSAAGQSGNSENPPAAEVTTSPVPNPDVTANQTSTNEEAAYNASQAAAAEAENATKTAIANSSKSLNTDPSSARLDANGLTSKSMPPGKSPASPSVSVGGVKKEDLRVRIALAPQSPNIFYKDSKNDLLKPLKETDGVVFPIQPTITIGHEARYQATDLTHSNFTFWNYQNSAVKPISITGDFLIRNPYEGRYCVAAIRFLQAMTKMFNANDTANNMKGAPPAVARLYGLGLMGFDSIPVVVTSVDTTYGSDVDLLSLAVAVDGTTEVTKLPASFQITVTLNPVFSREFATNFFGTQDYASGKVRLLGKKVITPIATTNPAPAATSAAAAPGAASGNVAGNTTTTSNQVKPDSAAGNTGNSAVTAKGVTPASTPGDGTNSTTETTKEKTKTTNADGSTTEVVTETVNGVKTVTSTNTDKDGKVTTTVSGGASGTGADSSGTKAEGTGSGGDNAQPKDEAAATSNAEKIKALTEEFRATDTALKAQLVDAMAEVRSALDQVPAKQLALLQQNNATDQADLTAMQGFLSQAESGTAFPIGGYPSIAALKADMEQARKDIASRQAKIDAGSPYGLTEALIRSLAESDSTYMSAVSKVESVFREISDNNSQAFTQVGIDNAPNSSSSMWNFKVPPKVEINGTTY